MPLRFALTGRHDGPELAALLAAIPQSLVRDRLVRRRAAGRRLRSMLRIHNSLTGRKEPFEPLEPGKVRMYVCGITVYDHCHIGHARMLIAFDVVRRYLQRLAATTSPTCATSPTSTTRSSTAPPSAASRSRR